MKLFNPPSADDTILPPLKEDEGQRGKPEVSPHIIICLPKLLRTQANAFPSLHDTIPP